MLRMYDLAEAYLRQGLDYSDERGLYLHSRQLRVIEVLVDLGRGRLDRAVELGRRQGSCCPRASAASDVYALTGRTHARIVWAVTISHRVVESSYVDHLAGG